MASIAFAGGLTEFSLPAQPLTLSLRDLAKQANINVLFDFRSLDGRQAPALQGRLTVEDALAQLLAGTGFQAAVVDERTIVLERPSQTPTAQLTVPERTSRSEQPLMEEGAGEDAGKILQEITVTANRREEELGKVPLSVAAWSQDALEHIGAKDILDIARVTPGLSTINQGNAVSMTIRGIASSAGAATTGIYIDDTPVHARALSTASQAMPKLFDLDRVEILRGPQGTLFGAGSLGGTVRYIMTQPSLTEFSVRARTEISHTEGGAPSYEAGLAAGGPIFQDALGLRASVWHRRDGGWIDRVNPSTLDLVRDNNNSGESTAVRVAAKWAPRPSLAIEPSIAYQVRKLNDVPGYWDPYSNPREGQFISGALLNSPQNDSYLLSSLKITGDLGAVELVSNTSNFDRTDHSAYDGTTAFLAFYQTLGRSGGIPFAGYACPTHDACYPFVDGSGVHLPSQFQDYRIGADLRLDQQGLTQELRLQSIETDASLQWTIGLFHATQTSRFIEANIDPNADRFATGVFGMNLCAALRLPCNADGSTPLAGDSIYIGRLWGRDRQFAAFGEAVLPLSERIRLTTGLRYSEVTFAATSFADGPINFGQSYSSGTQRENKLTERLGLSFQKDSRNLYYVTYATGFRPGGVNAPVPASACPGDFDSFGIEGVPASYNSDSVRSFEFGTKNSLRDRIKIASSVYYVSWKDIQQSVTLPTCQFVYSANLGAAESKGADVEIEWAITRALVLNAAVGYMDARYTRDVLPGPAADTPVIANGDAIVTGQGSFSQPPSPWVAAVGMQSGFVIQGQPSYIRVDYQYANRNGTAFAASDPRTVQYDPYISPTPSSALVSLRAGIEIGRLQANLFIDNLFDADSITSLSHSRLYGSSALPQPSPLYTYTSFRPRTFGLSLIYRD